MYVVCRANACLSGPAYVCGMCLFTPCVLAHSLALVTYDLDCHFRIKGFFDLPPDFCLLSSLHAVTDRLFLWTRHLAAVTVKVNYTQ